MKLKSLLFLLIVFCFSSCSEDKYIALPTLSLPKLLKVNKVQLDLKNKNSKIDNKVVIVMQDYDGINKGKQAVTSIQGKLKPNSIYYGYAHIMYEDKKKKISSLNKNILKESTKYLFFMNTNNENLASFKPFDNDTVGYPIGITFILETGKPGEKAVIGFKLCSILEKNKAVIKEGKIENTKTETIFFANMSLEL